MYYTEKINDRVSAVAFLNALTEEFKASFHLDDPFAEREDVSAEKATMLDERVQECFAVLEDEAYDICVAKLEDMNLL